MGRLCPANFGRSLSLPCHVPFGLTPSNSSPGLLVVVLVGQDVPNVQPLPVRGHTDDQAVLVSADVEYEASADLIGLG